MRHVILEYSKNFDLGGKLEMREPAWKGLLGIGVATNALVVKSGKVVRRKRGRPTTRPIK